MLQQTMGRQARIALEAIRDSLAAFQDYAPEPFTFILGIWG